MLQSCQKVEKRIKQGLGKQRDRMREREREQKWKNGNNEKFTLYSENTIYMKKYVKNQK